MILYPILASAVFSLGGHFGLLGRWGRAVRSDRGWMSLPPKQGKVVWMHCASLGEFEMGRPVLEGFLDDHQDWQAVVTFFSPSGYEPRRGYDRATVHYLPMDTPAQAKKWLHYCNPSLAVFVRYDLWPNHISGLRKKNIPAVVMAMSAPKIPWYLNRFLFLIRRQFTAIHTWGVVGETDAAMMSLGGIHSEVLGNPKYDYAAALVNTPIPKKFKAWKQAQEKPILLIGSAHLSDCLALNAINLSGFSIWVVPHDLKESAVLQGALKQYKPAQCLTSLSDEPKITDLLMVPEFGVLAGLYALADGVIIGGGWDKATHNVLEATAQGKIAACGPNWQKIAENHELVQQGYLQPIDAHGDWMKYLDQVGSEELAAKGEQARAWMLEQRGSAEKIVKVLEEAVQL